jgi:hypothetical protein
MPIQGGDEETLEPQPSPALVSFAHMPKRIDVLLTNQDTGRFKLGQTPSNTGSTLAKGTGRNRKEELGSIEVRAMKKAAN